MSSLPIAKVLYWNQHGCYVECPFCQETHRHYMGDPKLYSDPGSKIPHRQTRSAQCDRWTTYRDMRYRLDFPMEQGDSWWIDKENGFFVRAGASLPPLSDHWIHAAQDADEHLANALSDGLKISAQARLPDDATELSHDLCNHEGHHCAPTKTMVTALAECKGANFEFVKCYLQDSPEASLFLNGCDESGTTTLMLAATTKSLELVKLFIDRGARIDAKDKQGRTALMQVALWGRYPNVKFLIEIGAHKSRQDYEGRTALDLASPDRRNRKERHHHFLACGEQEDDVYERNLDRKRIVRFLSEAEAFISGDSSPQDHYDDISFDQDKEVIHVQKRVQTLDISDEYKAVAVLQRSGPYVDFYAMSGWANSRIPDYLNGEEWTNRVMDLASTIGYTLGACPSKDRGTPGRFNASHAEKQLVAKFVSIHALEPRDFEQHASSQGISLIEKKLRSLESSDIILQLKRLGAEDPGYAEPNSVDPNTNDASTDFTNRIKVIHTAMQETEQDLKRIAEQQKKLSDIEMQPDRRLYRKLWKLLEPMEHFWEMRYVRPRECGLQHAKIFVSSHSGDVCLDCQGFIAKVNEHFKINIEAVESTKTKGPWRLDSNTTQSRTRW